MAESNKSLQTYFGSNVTHVLFQKDGCSKQNTVNGLYQKPSANEEFKEVVHVLGFVHIPRSSPLALGVFMAGHSLPVDCLALPLPPQVLLLLLFRRRHVQVKAALQEGSILSRSKTGYRILARKQPGGDIWECGVHWTVMKCCRWSVTRLKGWFGSECWSVEARVSSLGGRKQTQLLITWGIIGRQGEVGGISGVENGNKQQCVWYLYKRQFSLF